MTTVVTNIRDLEGTYPDWRYDPRYVYIGRANKKYQVKRSRFNNPFPASVYGRAGCIEKFREMFENDPDLQDDAKKQLKDKVLVCWCKPKPCHGDILADYVNNA